MLVGLAIASANAQAAPFTPNSIVVERFGDGSTPLSGTVGSGSNIINYGSAAARIAVLEYNPSGTLLQTLTSQFTDANLQTDAGASTSSGYLGFGGGQYLAVPGLQYRSRNCRRCQLEH